MELTERIDLLLGMKERANGAHYKAYYHDTAIHIVNSQSDSRPVCYGAIASRDVKTPVQHEQGD